jgi:hypothetical protein
MIPILISFIAIEVKQIMETSYHKNQTKATKVTAGKTKPPPII